MGAADLIPGISGGTIALITGVYEKLLKSINYALKYKDENEVISTLKKQDYDYISLC